VDEFAGRTVTDEQDGYALIRARQGNHPRVGEPAPDFELDLHDGTGRVRLSSFRGDQPVVLIFGSLT
jgi:peroxiredoxin